VPLDVMSGGQNCDIYARVRQDIVNVLTQLIALAGLDPPVLLVYRVENRDDPFDRREDLVIGR